MNTQQIWKLEKHLRLHAFIDRYLELDEFTGCRTLAEKDEMLEIATAILPTLILDFQKRSSRLKKVREGLDGLLLDLYPMTIANAALEAGDQREFADDVAKHIGVLREFLGTMNLPQPSGAK